MFSPLTGFLLNISNPKMPIFYLALLPGVLGIRPLTVSDTAELLVIIALIEVVGGHVFLGYKAKPHWLIRTRTEQKYNKLMQLLEANAAQLMPPGAEIPAVADVVNEKGYGVVPSASMPH